MMSLISYICIVIIAVIVIFIVSLSISIKVDDFMDDLYESKWTGPIALIVSFLLLIGAAMPLLITALKLYLPRV